MAVTPQEVYEYHRQGRPGKIEVIATKPVSTQRDLSLAYSPGVAEVVLEVERRPEAAYEYTAKANLVAVISNGTAILGLGQRGALASKPVMEGKGVLFKRFADIDVFDIEVDTATPDEVIAVVRAIAPTFGGINLEDIKAPECFYIEEKLRALLDIPVFHDDQHGTAIITGAALLNGCELTGKKLEDLKITVTGAGAAALSTVKFYLRLGVQKENIMLVDEYGIIYAGREIGMDEYKVRFARQTPLRTLAQAMEGADMFLGLSVGNIVTGDMVRSMGDRPLIFALANPTPEISYEEAKAARPDAIVGTGRSDYPNQVNNVLGFPSIFRGALDVRARAINDEMKLAAAYALAELAHEDVPDSVLTAYNLEALSFGPDYLIPKPFDPRVLLWEAPAVARAAIESGVARINVDLDTYADSLAYRQNKGMQVRQFIVNKAKSAPKRVVFGEGEEPRIIRAAARIEEEEIAHPILLGRPNVIAQRIAALGIKQYTPDVIDPDVSPQHVDYARVYFQLRQRKGVTKERALEDMHRPNIFGQMMVKRKDADAFLSGLVHDYPDVIRPALQIFHTKPGTRLASGVYLVIVNKGIYLFTDATVNINPTADDLAEIALLAADFARQLEITPRVAMLSFSNFGSTPHEHSIKVRRAVEILHSTRPALLVDGEVQADVAVVPELMESRYPFSRVKDANVLVFPSLEAANIAYKLLSRLGGAITIGPILLGLDAPIHVLQTGDDVEAIVAMTAVAVMDSQTRK
ncbi:MAG TPA: NADP-dependent malic enzyme [Aggregatilineales bacterium]|nr:NADP-dependent malic enzyme [Aggregatilineales bacterium]